MIEYKHTLTPGQVWRSLKLRDYRVRLVRPDVLGTFDDNWLIEPEGTSAGGSYTERERYLLDPDLYEPVEQAGRDGRLRT